MSSDVKRYERSDFDLNIQLVRKPSDIDPYDDDPSVLRAVLSCGHITDPQSLTDYCKIQLMDGKAELRCPLCGKQWSYTEVRKLGKLTPEEQQYFEEVLANRVIEKLLDVKNCPGCDWIIERSDLSSLCVHCTVCSANQGRIFEFCWQCLREWRGPQPRSDRCENEGCTNEDLDLLRNCANITLTDSENIECPAVRACPACGLLLNHNAEKSKSIVCCRCKTAFCFVCLKLRPECLKTSGFYSLCSDGVAPRQTAIQLWRAH